jgi:excinuclease ABC subunit A
VPATYVGCWDEIRRLFALTPEARLRGYSASRFSFNSPQGRCPQCLGAGLVKLEMSFMPPAHVRCETCAGARFNRETLDIECLGRNIAQTLDLTVARAAEVFAAFPRIARPLRALCETGLDYIQLGQPSPTLSGGEAQRLKLVTHLLAGFRGRDGDGAGAVGGAPNQSAFLFLLEEPTIGLHMADVERLVEALQRLVNAGNTVIVIEHNLDLIAEADWIIDLGPGGGEGGGRIVAQGTPESVAGSRTSRTGAWLRRTLGKARNCP